MSDQHPTKPLEIGTTWQHKRLDKQARVNSVSGVDVQVIDDAKNTIRWLSVKGFLRDYAPVPSGSAL